jgi:hypothetical protein
MMNQNQNEKLLKEITSLKAKLDELKERFDSDYCKKCRDIEIEIQGCEQQIMDLKNLFGT